MRKKPGSPRNKPPPRQCGTDDAPGCALLVNPATATARLPEGERLLWQGSPAARSLAHHLFRIGGVAVYFAVILAFCAFTEWRHGWTVSAIGMASLHKAGFALV